VRNSGAPRRGCKVLVLHLLLFAGIGAFVLVSMKFFQGCPIRHLTGIPCPTCGVTRSLASLVRLDFARALHFHPLSLPICLAILIAFHYKPLHIGRRARDIILIATSGAVFAVYIVRLIFFTIP